MKALEILSGVYATRIYIPFSRAARKWKIVRNKLRGKEGKFVQEGTLPKASWPTCVKPRWARLVETGKANGNVRVSELAILAHAAAGCCSADDIFEIGTFDGRTTLNLALNSESPGKVFTLDLPPDQETKFDIAQGERHFVDKPVSGQRYLNAKERYPDKVARIEQLFGDSATFDYSPYEGKCGLVFVDGSHAYDYAMSDTKNAMRLVRPGGSIIWHDYGVWKGVTTALEELEQKEKLGLRSIAGTSLVHWRKPTT